ncbi:SCO family protein [Aureibaculum sp. 2210JD6-5]|uniref:SCO family protein n=1 Tax=Aureibaculum sp. 2210JD6-5 TaxID=3103957 RepID=UPI002AACF400|nr:SCO family protein [Aureibaculum sp. 2210JD6-5]MDY7396234.1 SCO family protein [Aureibaculum sp. 2210JD6-5]
MKKTYIGIAFIVLVFGIWAVPKIVNRLSPTSLLKFEKVPDFEFTNQNNETISNKDFKDKVYVVEFFFTSCPTICPKMHQSMLKIQDEFYGNPNFGIVSVTIDPKRDTPEALKKYAEKHNVTLKNWHFLTGEKEAIYNFSNNGFKLYAGENAEAEGGFEHSGLFALIDKNGFIRSRTVQTGEFENPIKFYDGLDSEQVQMLKVDIDILLNE